ncbi:hypothetical protein SPAR_31636 [Streptomyces sparsogenes DSM 40356]|uniref:Uncharacterized protein n=1 Tax=Streptomyces sparsogenes DSM 40356 TaxID=1331668 RepID=A0A1R1SBC2_9ACTN|nr:hypothetical protein SPAR_31636 [Streptomyces sparsogenes DSM 40356]
MDLEQARPKAVRDRWAPGTDTSAQGVARRDFWEEVYLVEGALHDLTAGRAFTAGMYARMGAEQPDQPASDPRAAP